MITFLLILILVFVGVDLLVRLVIDPLASGSTKKHKVAKPFTSRFDPNIRLASETMYDGGTEHNPTASSNKTETRADSKQSNEISK